MGALGPGPIRRNLGSRLSKTEYIIDKQQHILMLFVAKVFGYRQACQSDTQARPGRFRHLPVNESRFFNDSGFLHVEPEIVALARTLSNSGKD